MTDIAVEHVPPAPAPLVTGRSPEQMYRAVVATFATLLMFSGVTVFAYDRGLFPAPPLVWLILLMGVASTLLLSGRTWRVITASPVLVCLLIYLVISIVSFTWSTGSAIVIQEIRARILTTIVVAVFLTLFSSERAIRAARVAMIPCMLLSVVLNVYEVFDPMAFSLAIGRSAGFYQNPNVSATALNLGLIFSIGVVPKRIRAFYVVMVMAGLFLTLSRGGMLSAALVLIYYLVQGTLRLRRIASAAAIFGMLTVGAVIVSGRAREITDFIVMITQSGVINRLLNPEEAIGGTDASVNTRAEVAAAAWELMREHPVLGAGIGATMDWEYDVSTHNIYARMLAEFGVLGILIYPMILWGSIWRARGDDRVVANAFLIFMIPAGLFSHNGLDEWGNLIAIALMTAMSVTGRLRAKAEQGDPAPVKPV